MHTVMNTISIKIPNGINDILNNVAKNEDRSKSSVIRKAIKQYLEDYEDLQIAKKAYREYKEDGEKHYSLKEMKKKYGL
jgi:predicted DNA-binding protein